MNIKENLIQFIKYQIDRYNDNPDGYSQDDISEAEKLIENIASGKSLSYLQNTTCDNVQRMILSDYVDYITDREKPSEIRAYHKWLTQVELAEPVNPTDFTTNKSHWFTVNKQLWRQV